MMTSHHRRTIGPGLVPPADREVAGATMTFALLVGLAAGSTIALMFSAIPFAETNFTLDPTEL